MRINILFALSNRQHPHIALKAQRFFSLFGLCSSNARSHRKTNESKLELFLSFFNL